jgi:hypothetical protein
MWVYVGMSKSSSVNALGSFAVATLEELTGLYLERGEGCCVMYSNADGFSGVDFELAYRDLALMLDF